MIGKECPALNLTPLTSLVSGEESVSLSRTVYTARYNFDRSVRMSDSNGESPMDRIERNMEKMEERHREMMGEIQALHVNLESLHSSASELHASTIELREGAQRDGENIRQLYATAVRDGENIRALARIAEAHERRPSDLESGPGLSSS
jgi:methyl-accepting chemotaxis protein